MLNVKQIALRMQGEGPKRLQLSATGPADVTAGMIAMSGDIEVMNPDLLICHLDESATLNMELTADTGKGYVAAASNRPWLPENIEYMAKRLEAERMGCTKGSTRSWFQLVGLKGARREISVPFFMNLVD